MVYIIIVNGVINQLITRGHHIAIGCVWVFWRFPKLMFRWFTLRQSNIAIWQWKMDHRTRWFSSRNLHSVRGFSSLLCLITRGYPKLIFHLLSKWPCLGRSFWDEQKLEKLIPQRPTLPISTKWLHMHLRVAGINGRNRALKKMTLGTQWCTAQIKNGTPNMVKPDK